MRELERRSKKGLYYFTPLCGFPLSCLHTPPTHPLSTVGDEGSWRAPRKLLPEAGSDCIPHRQCSLNCIQGQFREETHSCSLEYGCLWTQILGLLPTEEVDGSQTTKAEYGERAAGYTLNMKMFEFPRIQLDIAKGAQA